MIPWLLLAAWLLTAAALTWFWHRAVLDVIANRSGPARALDAMLAAYGAPPQPEGSK